MSSILSRYKNALARKALKFINILSRQHWNNFPFGKEPRASRDVYLELWKTESSKSYPEIDDYEQQKGFSLNKEWLDNLALHTQIVIKNSPLCYQHGRVLYTTLCEYLKNKTTVTIFETGTARGFSSVIMAKAIADLEARGKIITFDVLPHHVPMFWNSIDDFDGPKSRSQLLSAWKSLVSDYVVFVEGDSKINLEQLNTERINFAFLDGAHSYKDVKNEFSIISKRQKKDDIIVFDDYNLKDFPGLVKAVDLGCEEFSYQKNIISCGNDRSYVVAVKMKD